MIKFIKRLCYRFSKRLIRLFIFFNVLVCFFTFSFSSLALSSVQVFNKFSSLIANGSLSFTAGRDYVLYDVPWSNTSGGQDPNDFIVLDAPSQLGSMDSFSFKIMNSDNFQSIQPGDVLYLKHSVTILLRSGTSQIYYSYANADLDDIQVRIDTDAGYTILSGDDVIRLIEFDYDKSECTINFEYQYQFNTSSTLRSLTYYFYHFSDSNDIGVNFAGHGTSITPGIPDNYEITYFLGSENVLDKFLFTDIFNSIDSGISSVGSILSDTDLKIDSINDNILSGFNDTEDKLVDINNNIVSGTNSIDSAISSVGSTLSTTLDVLQNSELKLDSINQSIDSGFNLIGGILSENFTNDYPEFIDSGNEELGEVENEVIDSFDYSGEFNDFYTGSNGWRGFFTNNSQIRQCFYAIGDMYNYCTTFAPLRFLMYISISLGLLSMTLNFTAVLVSNMSQDKRGDFNKHGSVGRGHGGGR